MTDRSDDFTPQLAAVRGIAAEVAAKHAADVDARSRFPSETLAALRAARLLSAPIPPALGGGGFDLRQHAEICATLAKACGSSAMVLAMHYVQLACIVRHGREQPYWREFLRECAERQYLLGSLTSENGTFGEMRASLCAVQRAPEGFVLEKDATTGSYCAQADAILVTARRDRTAPETDQVLVCVRRADARLEPTGTWDALGMRGTCSPGYRLHARGGAQQILSEPFADIAVQTMVPYSHVLWSSLWWGLAADALGRAGEYVRDLARRHLGSLPANAVPLAHAAAQLEALRHHWLGVAAEIDALAAAQGEDRRVLNTIEWALKLNHLKVAASEASARIVHEALQVTGLLGYKNDSPYSVGRQYRDVLSASLMISNGRLLAKNASMLLVCRER